jgi:hypothetical protein
MESMRSTWTDSRLDDFAVNTDRRFDTLERRIDEGFREVRGEISSLQRTIIGVGGGVIAAIMGVIATQL